MLSQSAFNAFLKTLEEPPPYAIFIMATTERHKILPTILSRCQIFDFHRIRISDITDQLKRIAEKESIEVEEEALHVVAQKADGAMRDALSMFDRIASFSGQKMTYQDVINNLSILDYEYYFQFSNLFLENNTAEVLLKFNEINEKGFDLHNFLLGLSEHFRSLLVCKDPSTVELLDLPESAQVRYKEQAQQFNLSYILSALNILNSAELNFRISRNQRLHVELALMKLCHLNAALDLGREIQSGEVKKKSN